MFFIFFNLNKQNCKKEKKEKKKNTQADFDASSIL